MNRVVVNSQNEHVSFTASNPIEVWTMPQDDIGPCRVFFASQCGWTVTLPGTIEIS